MSYLALICADNYILYEQMNVNMLYERTNNNNNKKKQLKDKFPLYVYVKNLLWKETWARLLNTLRSAATCCLKVVVQFSPHFKSLPRETGWNLFFFFFFLNTIGHSESHMHAARENDLLSPLPALTTERI